MKAGETCKVICSVSCTLIAGTCVLWILYVLIEKTKDEVKAGKLRMSRFAISLLCFYRKKNMNFCFIRMAVLD